jgi:hypothetical protein
MTFPPEKNAFCQSLLDRMVLEEKIGYIEV